VNPPTDPWQLLIYGIGTIFVVGALKLWDRRRDNRLQRTADTAVAHAASAEQHASKAEEHASAAAVSTAATEGATTKGSTDIAEAGRDMTKSLLYLAEQIGELRAEVRPLRKIPDRVALMEEGLDAVLHPDRIRRRRQEADA
jgi:hypothetical protein